MSLNTKQTRELLLVVFMALVFMILNAVWLWNFRSSGVFDIDEAGYLSISLMNYQQLEAQGVWGWIKSIESPSIQAPVTTAVTSFFYMVFWPQTAVGFGTIIAFGVVTIISTYYLGRALGGTKLGVLTSILVATSPVIINYSRSYSFAIPVTAVTTLALLSLVKSNHFQNWKWATMFGIFLGLMPLTRTMTIAFLPGMILAAIVATIVPSEKRLQRLGILMFALLLGTGVALSWLFFNGAVVFQYLTSFGYGNRAVEFSSSQNPQNLLSNLMSLKPLLQYVISNIYLPDFILLFLGGVLLTVLVVKNFIHQGLTRGTQAILHSEMLPLIVCIGEGVVAITSSQNKGSGFLAPLMPGLFLISSWAFTQYQGRVGYHLTWIAIGTVALISGLPFISLSLPIAKPWQVNLPVVGRATITDGSGTLQLYETAGNYASANPNIPVDNKTSQQWENVSATTARELTQLGGTTKLTATGFRNRLYNVNTINLEQLLSGRDRLPLSQVEPIVTGDSPAGYLKWLQTGDTARATLLITAAAGKGDFSPVVNSTYMETAAKNAGFSLFHEHALPDGREIKLWKRTLRH